MVTLAIDTSHAVGSVALARDGELLGSERFDEPSSHLVALGRSTQRLLAAQSLRAREIERIAVVTGPGSFTGLRIGLGFAKGLHAARGAALVPIDTLHLLALPYLAAHESACTMVDARRQEVYAAVFERTHDAEDPSSARVVIPHRAEAPEAFLAALARAPACFVGTGVLANEAQVRARFPGAVIAPEPFPSTELLARIAHRMQPLLPAEVRALEPLYLRPSGAERMRLRSIDRKGVP